MTTETRYALTQLALCYLWALIVVVALWGMR